MQFTTIYFLIFKFSENKGVMSSMYHEVQQTKMLIMKGLQPYCYIFLEWSMKNKYYFCKERGIISVITQNNGAEAPSKHLPGRLSCAGRSNQNFCIFKLSFPLQLELNLLITSFNFSSASADSRFEFILSFG